MQENDVFIKKKEILNFIKIGETKLDELIKSGNLIKPIKIDGFGEKLFSQNELQKWMKEKLENRNEK